jgi:hypothetical protein
VYKPANDRVKLNNNSKHMFQVAEVGVIDRTRLSVNGWFHGPLPECRNIVPNINMGVLRFSPIKVTLL